MNPTGVRRSTAGEGRAAAVRRCSSRRRGRPPSPTATTVPSSTIPPRGARPVSGSASSGNEGVTSRPFAVRSRSRSGRTCARQRSPSQANSTTQSLPSGSGPDAASIGVTSSGIPELGPAGGAATPDPVARAAPVPERASRNPARAPARPGGLDMSSDTASTVTAACRVDAGRLPPPANGRPPAPGSPAQRTIGTVRPPRPGQLTLMVRSDETDGSK